MTFSQAHEDDLSGPKGLVSPRIVPSCRSTMIRWASTHLVLTKFIPDNARVPPVRYSLSSPFHAPIPGRPDRDKAGTTGEEC